MKTWQNYDPAQSGPILLSSTAYRVAVILFDDYLNTRAELAIEWFQAFQINLLDVLSRIGFTENEGICVLRSMNFCHYVQAHLTANGQLN